MAKRINLFDQDVYDKHVNEDNKLLLEDYVMELKSRGLAEKTIYQYTSDIRAFYCYLYENVKNAYILDLKKRDFRRFFLKMSDNGTSSARINRFQSSIRNMLEYAVEDDDEYDYEINAMASIKGIKGEKVREITFLTDEQIDIILNYLLERELYEQALYLSLSYDSAARRNEVLQVEKNDFVKNNMTNEVIGKRGKKFKLFYFDRTKKIAEKYLKQRGEDNEKSMWVVGKGSNVVPRSYESFYSWVVNFRKILLEETGEVVNINPNCFRHSALTNYENGTHSSLTYFGKKNLGIDVLKVLANHDSIDTTQSYLPDKDEELLMGALGLLGGTNE